jgi:hypothetical protein
VGRWARQSAPLSAPLSDSSLSSPSLSSSFFSSCVLGRFVYENPSLSLPKPAERLEGKREKY